MPREKLVTRRTRLREKRGKNGRPEHRPTVPIRNHVITLRSIGWSPDRIARVVGLSTPTLLKHYQHELDHGVDLAKARLMEQLEGAARKGNVAAVRLKSEIMKSGGLDVPNRDEALPTVQALAGLPPPTLYKRGQKRVGKKELEKIEARQPDTSSEMGSLMALRQPSSGSTTKLN